MQETRPCNFLARLPRPRANGLGGRAKKLQTREKGECESMRREVFKNIARFKENLSGKGVGKPHAHKKVYLTLINQHTGDMRFSEETNLGKGWEKTHLTVEDERGVIHFRLNDIHGKHLKPNHFHALAWKIASETLNALNELAETHLPLSKKSNKQIEEAPGWVEKCSNRIEAEKMLLDQPVGTYLITRCDETIEEVAMRLAETNHTFVAAYVATVVRKDDRISELLLLHTKWGWTIFTDEPNLQSASYHHHKTWSALFKALKDLVKTPLNCSLA